MTDWSRRRLLAAGGGAGAAGMLGVLMAGCAPQPVPDPVPSCGPPPLGPPGPLPAPGAPGLLDEAAFQARVQDYLRHATEVLSPGDINNVVAHLLRAERDPAFTWDPGAVTVDSLGDTFGMLDDWKDTGDFRILYLHWLVRLGEGILDPQLLAEVRRRFLDFRYWWDDPLPAERVDHKWFWSENHRLIFAVDEYLSGQLLPDEVFTVTGLTGTEHRARARARILEWIEERSRFGFFEWHSNVYMVFNLSPLVTLVELADGDEELVRRAVPALDLCLFDIAAHLHRGSYGATRGRTYKKDKMSSLDENTWCTAKLVFDDTELGWTSRSDNGATFLSAARRYRCPEALVRIARSDEVGVVKERHGFPLDPKEAIGLTPPRAAFGYSYDDPADLPFWWSQGALTSWQVVPMTLREARRFRLWESDLFREFGALRQFADVDGTLAAVVAHGLAPAAAFGVLGEANTITWRSPEAMLSSVVDHRPGDKRDQVHSWQATLDADALVFTTHPSRPTPQSLDWSDDDGYWTGTASNPRSAQYRNAAVHLYAPAYDSPGDPLLGPTFGYLPETHAYFPVERFDEWVERDGWVLARRGDGYVALWSWRPADWRIHDPARVATRGMVRFDLVAPGGADNVWVVEVGRAAEAGSFGDFVRAVTGSRPEVTGGPADRRVTYRSPSVGELRFGASGPFTVDGREEPLRFERLESPWGDVCALGGHLDLQAEGAALAVDLRTGGRRLA
jgi:hypothetical protein